MIPIIVFHIWCCCKFQLLHRINACHHLNALLDKRVIPTNSHSTTWQRISRELCHSCLKLQGHKEEIQSSGTMHKVSFMNSVKIQENNCKKHTFNQTQKVNKSCEITTCVSSDCPTCITCRLYKIDFVCLSCICTCIYPIR